jgi:hypothetical protein
VKIRVLIDSSQVDEHAGGYVRADAQVAETLIGVRLVVKWVER